MNGVPYVDGWWGSEREITVVPSPEFPFRNSPTPDTFTRLYRRRFQVYPAQWVSRLGVRTDWTNLLLYSEALTGASWTLTNGSIDVDAATAPDGEETMGALLETVTNGEHSLAQAVTVTAAAHEVSIFGKAGLTREWLRLALVDSAAVTHYAFFNLSSGTIGNRSSAVTPQIVGLGDGYFRCVLRVTPAAGAGTFKVNVASSGSSISYAGSTTAGLYLWGAQVTLGTLTPYISTTIAARSISAPDRDPLDPFAFLIEEDNPDVTNSERQVLSRVYSRIPRQQIDPGSRFVTKPDLPGDFPQVSGNALIIQPEENVPRWLFYSQIPVTSDSGVPNGNDPTGGTYTITVGADTTAPINYNATAAAVAAAINALASVSARGSVSVTGSYTTSFIIQFLAYTAPTVDAAALTGIGSFSGVSISSLIYNVVDMIIVMNVLPGGATITGGTFTLTVFGQTTAAIAYNASPATVKAALEALSNVGSGNATVSTGSIGQGYSGASICRDVTGYIGTQIKMIIQIAPRTVTANGSSLTPTGSTAIATAGSFAYSTSLTFTGVNLAQRVLYAAAHGFTVLDGIVVTQGSNYRTIGPGLYTVDTNTITLTSASGVAFSDSTPITVVGAATGSAYTGGSKLTRTQRVTDFYLLGVSPGVDTLDDIPLPEYQGDAASLLAAIFAGDTDINYEVGELEVYRSGPMVQRTRTTINASTL